MKSVEFVSSISYALKRPLYQMLEVLAQDTGSSSGKPFMNPVENGYAIGSVILTVVMLESAIGRAHYSMRKVPTPGDKKLRALDYLESALSNADVLSDVAELFSLRDALVHNHLWIQEISGDDFEPVQLPSFLETWYGDKKFQTIVDSTCGKSKRLGLNMNPTQVGRNDVRSALMVTAAAGVELELLAQVGLGFNTHDAPFLGEPRTFYEVAEMF